jgi:hypothetical protein
VQEDLLAAGGTGPPAVVRALFVLFVGSSCTLRRDAAAGCSFLSPCSLFLE